MHIPIKIFCCYAHEDEALLNKLKAHLKPLQRQGLIDVWHDRDIGAGAEWEQEIKDQLNAAQIILLLVSPDFMDSDYCYGIEMQRAIERHELGEARVKVAHFVKTEKSAQLRATFLLFRYYSFCLCPAVPL